MTRSEELKRMCPLFDLKTDKFTGPDGVEVYVHPIPVPKPGDYLLDFPPGSPPEAILHGRRVNYWGILRELDSHLFRMLTSEQLAWLREIKPQVDFAIVHTRRADESPI